MLNMLKKIGIESQIDDFMDQVSESGLLCKNGIEAYLRGNFEAFTEALNAVRDAEHRGDALRKTLENDLYAKTLIPESRGDVMELLESMDTLLGRFNGLLWQFDIEKPQIYQDFVDDFRELLQCSVEAVESTVRSSRAFFKNLNAVADHVHKVVYWEKESDKVSTRLQRAIFSREEIELSHKIHLRFFVKLIDRIADDAEDVTDRLNIYVIKRML